MTFPSLLIFIFLVFWRPQDWLVPQLYGWPLLDVFVALAVVGFLIEQSEKRIRVPRSPVVLLLIGLFVATLMSHIAHTYLAMLISTMKETWKYCFITFLLVCAINSPKRLRAMAWIFVIMACVMSVHALLQAHRGYGFMGYTPIYVVPEDGVGAEFTRSYFFGIFEDPNDLAQMLATTIPWTFVIFRRRNVANLLISLGLSALLVMAIMSTHSRGGEMALATVCGVMILLILPARWTAVLLIMVMIGALALCPFAGPYLDESAHDRVDFWGQANYAFKSSPINMMFGVGYGLITDFIEGDMSPHNAFVMAYSELGVFGYWFWFNLLSLGILGCLRTRVATKRTVNPELAFLRRFAGMAIAAMAGFGVSSYFLTRAYVYPLFFLIAMLCAVPVIAEEMLPEGHAPLIRPRRDVWVYGTLGSLISILYVYFSIVILNKAFYG